jgi:oxygen-dependent protoporphyrinogen oxidase
VARGADVFDVVVDGGDAAALLAARECARFGFRVAVIDDPERWMFIPEDFTAHGDAVAKLCLELGVEVEVVDQAPEALNVVGIPVNPFSPSVRASIGWSGAWRVYLDRLRPLLQIGNEVNFDKLARRRLGQRAYERVVLPEVSRLFGITEAAVPVTALAPGLPEAMSRVGSLTGGALGLIATDPQWGKRIRVVGGTGVLLDALSTAADYFAVQHVTKKRGEKLTATVWMLDVATTEQAPSWELAIAKARHLAEEARTVLLSDPGNPPVGPIDLAR